MAARLRIGASSWSAPSWEGVFYPRGMPASEYLSYYASRFDTVEVDTTFYRTPSERMVDGWRDRTPDGFTFAAKVPQVITHEKILVDCGVEVDGFLRVMDRLGGKLGPLLFQFRYFKKAEFPSPDPFIDRLEAFLETLPPGYRFAVEVRNKGFVTSRFLDVLARRRVALAFIDHPWFFPIDRLMDRPGSLTTDFTYLRWLGDRKRIEEKTTTWNRLIVDRRREMERCVPAIRGVLDRGCAVYGYVNNHYAGYAIGSIGLFREIWDGGGGETPRA